MHGAHHSIGPDGDLKNSKKSQKYAEDMHVPFYEIVNVNTTRLVGGAFTAFIQFAQKHLPTVGTKTWDAAAMYEVLIQSLGGEISARKVNTSALRRGQYIGNCAVQSAVLIMDKLMLSEPLAERMRFFVFARASLGYFDTYETELKSTSATTTTHGEARRRLLLKGIDATLEQGERALEVGGFVANELHATLTRLQNLKHQVSEWQDRSIGAVPCAATASSTTATTTSSHLQCFENLPPWVKEKRTSGCLNVKKKRKSASKYKMPESTEDEKEQKEEDDENFKHVKDGAKHIKSALKALLESQASNDDPGSYWGKAKTIGAVQEILRELSLDAEYWKQVPVGDAKELLESIFQLQTRHFKVMHNRILEGRKRKHIKTRHIKTVDVVALLKVHTIIDILSLEKRSELVGGAELPAFHHPWVLRLLGVQCKGCSYAPLSSKSTHSFSLQPEGVVQLSANLHLPIDVAPLDLKGKWQDDLVKMRMHWLLRLPSPGANVTVDFFGFGEHGMSGAVNSADLREVGAVQAWLAETDTTSNAWKEAWKGAEHLKFDGADTQQVAVQLLGGKDGDGDYFRVKHLPGFAAAMRSTFLLEALRSTTPKCLGEWSGCGDTGRHFDDTIGSAKKSYTGSSRVGGHDLKNEKSCGGSDIVDGWGVAKLAKPITNLQKGKDHCSAMFEYTVNEVPEYPCDPTDTRRPRRRWSPNALVTPLHHPDMARYHMVQETRDLVGLSSVPSLQLADTTGLFSRRVKGLLTLQDQSENTNTNKNKKGQSETLQRSQLLLELLTEPGIREATDAAFLRRMVADDDTKFPSGAILDFARQAATLGIQEPRFKGLIGYLANVMHFSLDSEHPRLWDEGKLDSMIISAAKAGLKDHLAMYHFYRLLSFEACSKLECKQSSKIGCREVAGFIHSYDYVVAKEQWPEELEVDPHFNDWKRIIEDTFKERLKRDLRTVLEDKSSRSKMLNIALGEHQNLKRRDVKSTEAWRPFDQYPRYQAGDAGLSYDAATGRFDWGGDMGTTRAPKNLCDADIYKKVFGTTENRKNAQTVTVKSEAGRYSKSFGIDANFEYFSDKFGGGKTPITVRVRFDVNNTDLWHQAFNGDALDLPIGASKEGLAWVAVDGSCKEKGPHYYILPDFNNADAEGNGGLPNPIFDVRDDTWKERKKWLTVSNKRATRQCDVEADEQGAEQCELVDSGKGGPLINLVKRIEDVGFVFIFRDVKSKAAREISLPRLDNIRFLTGNSSSSCEEDSCIAAPNCLVSEALAGFGICSGAEPTRALGDFSQFLPLARVDKKGKLVKGALLPRYGSLGLVHLKQNHGGLVTPTQVKVERKDTWNSAVDYFLYEETQCTQGSHSSQCGELRPKGMKDHVLAAAHLASILLSERIYVNASRALIFADRTMKAQVWSNKPCANIAHMEKLHEIANFYSINNDSTPDAAAVRLRARAIVRRQVGLLLVSDCRNDQLYLKVRTACDADIMKQCEKMKKTSQGTWLDLSPAIAQMEADLITYHLHSNHVSDAVRLSTEEHRLLDDAGQRNVIAVSKRVVQPTKLIRLNEKYLEKLQVKIGTMALFDKCGGKREVTKQLWGKQSPRGKGEVAVPLKAKFGTHPLALTAEHPFTSAFPDELLVIHALMRNSSYVGSLDAADLAKQLGLKTKGSCTHFELQQAVATQIELRFRYLLSALRDRNDFKSCDTPGLLPELAVLATLRRASGPGLVHTREVNTKTKKHVYLSNAAHVACKKAWSCKENLIEDTLKESQKIWTQWIDHTVGKHGGLEALQADSDATRSYKKVGPMQLFKNSPVVRQLPPSARDGRNYLMDEHRTIGSELKDVLARLAKPLVEEKDHEFRAGFTKENHATVKMVPSPFNNVGSESSQMVKQEFAKHQKDWHIFTDEYCNKEDEEGNVLIQLPDNCDRLHNYMFKLSDRKKLKELLKEFQAGKEQVKKVMEKVNTEVKKLVNIQPPNRAAGAHGHARVVRSAARRLTPKDIKLALVMGKNMSKGFNATVDRMIEMNPYLFEAKVEASSNIDCGGLEVIPCLLRKQVISMIYHRERQRYDRVEKVITTVLDVHESDTSHLSDKLKDVYKVLREKTYYDLASNPVLLLLETESIKAFWKPQAEAIAKLDFGTIDAKAALVELAMGLGKTSMIAPAILNLLADGNELPVLVLLGSLLPSMAEELSKEFQDSFGTELRVLPIARIKRKAEDLDRLREEMETMMELRVPLVWSASDIQTLINSYIEHMEGSGGKSQSAATIKESAATTVAWQKLFGFLRKRANIIGDEIHAILDILTTCVLFDHTLYTRWICQSFLL